MHVCSFVQTSPAPHVPHDPPQPSSPHARPAQFGTHVSVPDPVIDAHTYSLQIVPGWHEPQTPPQPSGPHCRPSQMGSHVGFDSSSEHATVDNATAHSIAKRHIFPFELFISRPICATQPLRTTCENHLFSYYFAPMQSTFIARSSFRCLARLLHDKIASVVKNERQ